MRIAAATGALLLAVRAGAAPPPAPRVMSGLDVLEAEDFAPLRGKRVGVITNQTGVDARGRSIVELLARAPGVALARVFAPEHGLRGLQDPGAAVSSGVVRAAGRVFPLATLYGGGLTGMRPTPEQLRGLDALVFDIQDVGVRFYSYETTMATSLEAARRNGLDFFVLDRPDPVRGDVVQGPDNDVPSLTRRSSISYLPVPIRHGLTIGELARLHNETVRHDKLTVVAMRGWRRSMWFDDTGLPWVAPSPNMPDLAAAALYPGLGNLDFTNVSVGRGTPHPFGWICAPWLDAAALARRLESERLAGVRFTVREETPTRSLYAGRPCRGVRIATTDRDAVRPLRVFAHIVAALRDQNPSRFDLHWGPDRRGDTRTILGVSSFQARYDRGASAEELADLLDPPTAAFRRRRAPDLLYPDE